MAQHRALSVVPVRCKPCQDTGVMHLAAHWTGAEVDLPAKVRCCHCEFPWLPIQTYCPRRDAS